MKVVIKPEAFDEIERVRGSIALDRPDVAAEWIRRVFRRLRMRETFPRAGRVIPEFRDADLRELIFGNYRILYRVKKRSVRVLCFWDARREELPDRVEEAPVSYSVASL